MKSHLRKGLLISRYLRNRFFTKQTYAQCQEDLVIEYLLGKVSKFIDIGANDGISASNTFLFALKGAKGLCFEPVKSTFTRLRWLYFLNPKVICIGEGISNEAKEIQIQSEGLLSFIPVTQDARLKELLSEYYSNDNILQTISVNTLDYWLHHFPDFRRCDFVSLDIEGHELYALQGIDFSNFQAKCFVVETHALDDWRHRDYEKINSILIENDYRPLLKNTLNTFWFFKDTVSKQSLGEISLGFLDYDLI